MQVVSYDIPKAHLDNGYDSELDMAPVTVATLEERVKNHIRFFWVAVGAGFGWLAVLSVLVYNINSTVSRVEKAQANAPAQIVASLLDKPAASRTEAAAQMGAVSTILQSLKVGPTKPDISTVKQVSAKILETQQEYPDLPQVWGATGAFITYKSEALPPSNRPGIAKGANCDIAFAARGWVFSNCEVSLEDLAKRIQDSKVNGRPAPFIFINCIVQYRGGSIPAKDLIFQNSVFRFHVSVVPPREGIMAMQKLTTAETDKPVEISLG